jgi:hypothetical protein
MHSRRPHCRAPIANCPSPGLQQIRWQTEPAVSWDVGRDCWATPFEHELPGGGPKAGALAAGSYHVCMALPMTGAFRWAVGFACLAKLPSWVWFEPASQPASQPASKLATPTLTS